MVIDSSEYAKLIFEIILTLTGYVPRMERYIVDKYAFNYVSNSKTLLG